MTNQITQSINYQRTQPLSYKDFSRLPTDSKLEIFSYLAQKELAALSLASKACRALVNEEQSLCLFRIKPLPKALTSAERDEELHKIQHFCSGKSITKINTVWNALFFFPKEARWSYIEETHRALFTKKLDPKELTTEALIPVLQWAPICIQFLELSIPRIEGVSPHDYALERYGQVFYETMQIDQNAFRALSLKEKHDLLQTFRKQYLLAESSDDDVEIEEEEVEQEPVRPLNDIWQRDPLPQPRVRPIPAPRRDRQLASDQSSLALYLAIADGDLDAVKKTFEKKPNPSPEYLLPSAIRFQREEIYQWLYDYGLLEVKDDALVSWRKMFEDELGEALEYAAQFGSLDQVRELLNDPKSKNIRAEFFARALIGATTNPHQEVLTTILRHLLFADETPRAFIKKHSSIAFHSRHLYGVKNLFHCALSVAFDRQLLQYAKEIQSRAREEGIEIPHSIYENAYKSAISNQQLPTLQWLAKNGEFYREKHLLHWAAAFGSEEIFSFCKEHFPDYIYDSDQGNRILNITHPADPNSLRIKMQNRLLYSEEPPAKRARISPENPY